MLLECIRCLKAIMNNMVGLRAIFDNKEALTLIARACSPNQHNVMQEWGLLSGNSWHMRLRDVKLTFSDTMGTGYKVEISPRGKWLHMQIYFTVNQVYSWGASLYIRFQLYRTILTTFEWTFLEKPNFHCKFAPQEAVKLLGAICMVPPDGHDKTLEAITIAAEMKGGER